MILWLLPCCQQFRGTKSHSVQQYSSSYLCVCCSGTFHVDQPLDVIGQVADVINPFLLTLEVIHTVNVRFNATSLHAASQSSGRRQPIFNRGTVTVGQNSTNSLIYSLW